MNSPTRFPLFRSPGKFGLTTFAAALVLLVGIPLGTGAQNGEDTPGPISLDLDLTPGYDGKTHTDEDPEVGDEVALEIAAVSGASGAVGFQFKLKYDPTQLEWVGAEVKGLFSTAFPIPSSPEIDGQVATVVYQAAILGGNASADAGAIAHAKFTVLAGFTDQATVELVEARYGDNVTVGPGGAKVFIGVAPALSMVFQADLNMQPGNQNIHTRRINPGVSFPVQVFGTQLRDITGFEIHTDLAPDGFDAGVTFFHPNPRFSVDAPSEGEAPTDGSAVGPIALDLNTANGDQGQRQMDKPPKPGDEITIDVAAVSGALGITGFQVTFRYDPNQLDWIPAGVQVKDLMATAFPIPRDPVGGQVTIQSAILGGTAAQDAGSLASVKFRVKPGFAGQTAVRLIVARYDGTTLAIGSGGAVVYLGGSPPPTSNVEVQNATVILRASALEPVSGNTILGEFAFRAKASFTGGQITFSQVIYNIGESSVTLEPNITLMLLPAQSDVPLFTQFPVPVTVTDTRAIIEWRTNKLSDGVVKYGTDPGELTQEAQVTDLDEIHRVTIEGLSATTRYFFQVTSTDAQGRTSDPAPFKPGIFVTKALDLKSPRILQGPGAFGITTGSAEIVLRTDEAATASVSFGTAEDALTDTASTDEPALVHHVFLDGLDNDTRYFYKVTVADLNDNEFETLLPRSFYARATEDDRAPVILGRPSIIGRSFNGAVAAWNTDERGNSTVFYGTVSQSLEDSAVVVESVREHRVGLANLLADTVYYYTARTIDASGNSVISEEFDFRTRGTADSKAPRIVRLPIVPRVSDEEAIIIWKTNEPATSTVQFDTTTAVYGDTTGLVGETISLATPEREHEVVLTNLSIATVYYFKVGSTDLAGNGPTENAGELSFVTRPVKDESAPVSVAFPRAIGITHKSAVITWAADEPHSAIVSYREASGDPSATQQPADEEFTDSVEQIKLKRRHNLTLPGLEAGTTYEVQVETIDAGGFASTAPVFSFTTRATADSDAPDIVKGPTIRNRDTTSVTIGWFTDEPADSRLLYSLFVEDGGDIVYTDIFEESGSKRHHSITLTGLTPGTKYRYAVGSADQTGNLVTTNANGAVFGLSKDHRFRTRGAAQDVPPVFLEGPIVEFTDEIALIKWKTDQLSSSRVVIGVVPGSDDADVEDAPVYGEPTQLVFDGDNAGDLLVTDHSVTVSGLTLGKDYLYLASSTNSGGLTGLSYDPTLARKLQPPGGFGSFTTSTEADTQFPVITSGPTVAASTVSSLTIEWATDESSDSDVSFGTHQDSLTSEEVSGSNVTTHQIVLTKLAAGTTYSYMVGSTDASGNGVTESKVGYGTTPSEEDLTAPLITDDPGVIYRNDRSATISWTTNEVADAEVSFWTSQDSLVQISNLPDFAANHAITLTNLAAKTLYYYQVASVDQSNNGPVESAVDTFWTDSLPDETPPVITDTSISASATDSTATITWVTNELSDSAVQYGATGGTLDFTVGDATDVIEHTVTLTNLQPSTTYAYIVESIDRAGKGPAEGTQKEFTTLATGAVTAPDPPADLTATDGNATVLLAWGASTSSGVTGYVVERALGQGIFAAIASLDAVTSYVDATVQNGTSYSYQVRAVGAKQLQGDASTSVDAAPASDKGPNAPTLFVKQGSPLTPTIVISNSTPLDSSSPLSYSFHLSTQSDFSDALSVESGVATGAGTGSDDPQNVTAWTVTRTLTDGTKYYWRVKASDGTFGSSYLTGDFTVDSTAPEYAGDMTGDFKVDFFDFLSFVKSYNKKSDETDYSTGADLKADGKVDFFDFLEFVKVYNKKYVKGPSSSKPAPAALAYGLDADTELHLIGWPTSTKEGANVIVEVVAANVSSLRGYGFRIEYDPSVLRFESLADGEGTLLTQDGRLSEVHGTLSENPVKGEVFVASAITYGGPAVGEGTVARLRFTLLQDHPQGDLARIAEGLLIDGKLNISAAQNLGGRLSLVPDDYALDRNYPNPFNPETTIQYAVPETGKITIHIYNILGQEVATLVDADHLPGFYTVRWNGRDRLGRAVASGVYLYRMDAGKFKKVHKMLLLK